MGFFKQTIKDLPLFKNDPKRILVRVDYNVPLKNGKVSDDLRIRASLPTLEYLLERGCSLVLISHLGRPDGKRNLDYSLEPVAKYLSKLIDKKVTFVDDIVGDLAYQTVKKSRPGDIIMLQNLRFDPREEEDDEKFAKGIERVARADYFVQDGFAVVHRAHASTSAITMEVPGVAGFLLEREYTTISEAMENPKRPFVAVLGGAKVSDKIKVVERFVKLADNVLIGGAMANTFLEYKGYDMGASKVETDQNAVLDGIYKAGRDKAGDKVDDFIITPVDVAVAKEFSDKAPRELRELKDVKGDDIALDVGDQTIDKFCKVIRDAGTVIWNGPLGMSEFPNFAHGSARVALELAMHPKIMSIVGGGDTADFVLKWDSKKGGSFTHVSTGGGAGLDLMAGKKLPGVECLLDAREKVR